MSYQSASPMTYQIDVVDQVGRAYRAVLDNTQVVVEMAFLPYLIVLGIEFVALLIPGTGLFGHVLAALVQAIAFLIFGAIFAVRWHRFILLGESVGGGLVPPGWAQFLVAGIKLVALSFAAWIGLGVIFFLPPHVLTAPLTMIGGIALGLCVLRVSLIFPAAAIERPVGLRVAWDWITGNFWRLFACALCCYLPFVIAQMLINWIAGIFPSLAWIVFEALRLAVTFAGAAVVAALLSHLYRDITGEPRLAPA